MFTVWNKDCIWIISLWVTGAVQFHRRNSFYCAKLFVFLKARGQHQLFCLGFNFEGMVGQAAKLCYWFVDNIQDTQQHYCLKSWLLKIQDCATLLLRTLKIHSLFIRMYNQKLAGVSVLPLYAAQSLWRKNSLDLVVDGSGFCNIFIEIRHRSIC
jgi:hypothetical protein